MADVAILASQVQATPNGYTIPGGQEIILKSIRVAYDGSGAGGSFVPVLQLIAPGPSSTVVAEYPLGQTLAAGVSADVTWFPGVVAAASGSGTSGIRYDFDNVGGSLQVETTGAITTPFSKPSGSGGDEVGTSIAFNAPKGFYISSDPAAGATPLTVEQLATGALVANGIAISVTSDTGKTTGEQIGYGNGNTSTAAGTQAGLVIGGGSKTTGAFNSLGVDVSDRNHGDGGSFGARLIARTDGAGDAIAASLSATASGAGTAYAAKVVAGLVDLKLPVVSGPAGTLWNNAGVVTVS